MKFTVKYKGATKASDEDLDDFLNGDGGDDPNKREYRVRWKAAPPEPTGMGTRTERMDKAERAFIEEASKLGLTLVATPGVSRTDQFRVYTLRQ